MPGKTDYSAGGAQGNYGFSKLVLAWNEGWLYRYSDTALNAPITDNPHPANTAKNQAWADGWNEAAANTGGARRMPATTGAPPT